MSFSNNVKNDRFGNPYQLRSMKKATNKKTGEVFDKIGVTYVELGGKLYKCEVSPYSSDKKDDRAYWLKVTKVDQKKRVTSM